MTREVCSGTSTYHEWAWYSDGRRTWRRCRGCGDEREQTDTEAAEYARVLADYRSGARR